MQPKGANANMLESLIRNNDVPESMLNACEGMIRPSVPDELWPHVQECISHARSAHGEAGRFFVLFSALVHSAEARELFKRGSPDQFTYWHDQVLTKGWCDLMMGVDENGAAECACKQDEMYSGLVDFVARMHTEYICAGGR